VRQLGRDLGVRYALEGSAQQSDNRVRVTAQLIDAESGAHLWPQGQSLRLCGSSQGRDGRERAAVCRAAFSTGKCSQLGAPNLHSANARNSRT